MNDDPARAAVTSAASEAAVSAASTGSSRFARLVCACLACVALACEASPRTELVVVVDSDMGPGTIDAVALEISGLGAEEQQARADLALSPLPRVLVLERLDGALGPIEILARAERGGSPTGVERLVRTSFVEGQTRRVDVFLAAGCASTTCEPSQTCGAEGCLSPDVDPASLPPWDGLGQTDGGVMDAEIIDDGGVTDSGVDGGVDADIDGGPCSCPTELPPNATGTRCDGGRCVLVCASLTGDCDGRLDNGCEQSLETSREHCGGCDLACPPPTGNDLSRACIAGTCEVTCGDRFRDCNGNGHDGCETDTRSDVDHCGACGSACAGRCMMSRCVGG